ncbi:PfkB family carbohydrate kinase [Brooklawnia cerclae]
MGAGDNVVDRYRSLGRYFPGGNAVNVAVFAARQGAASAYLGVVGDDEAGKHVLAALDAERVDTSHVRVVHGPNATADVDLVGNDRVFVGSDRGVAMFTPDARQLDVMAGYDVVHCGYASAMLASVPDLVQHTKVSYDFANRFVADDIVRHAGGLYLAAFSAGHLPSDEALRLVERATAAGARYVLATRGAAGAYLAGPHGVTFAAAEPIKAVDTLGAGDAFIATVLVRLFAGDPPGVATTAASHVAAQVCLDYGAFGHGAAYSPDDATTTSVSTTKGAAS